MSGKLRLFGNEDEGLREVWLAKRSLSEPKRGGGVWRRGESNPCPKDHQSESLHA